MAQFNILMMGPPRTGKSSLLASMIFNFDMVCSNYGLHLEPDEDTKIIMEKRLKSLEGLIHEHSADMDKPFPIDYNKTQAPDDYTFSLRADGSSKTHTLRFTDINGELVFEDLERDVLKKRIRNSQVIMIAIDTPHLVEENSAHNASFNNPKYVEKLLNDFEDEESAKLVLLVPIKCEKYYYENRMDEVNRCIKQEYAGLLEEYRENEKVNKKYTVAITPVLTAGGIVFSDFERDENGYVKTVKSNELKTAEQLSLYSRPVQADYKIDKANPYYCPQHCEQPVLYLLNFVLSVDGLTEKKQVPHNEDKHPIINFIVDSFIVVVSLILTLPLWLLGGSKEVKAFWNDVLSDRVLIDKAQKAKMELKKDGDGYEIVQNPFGW